MGYADVVLEGGGVKGIGLAGALAALSSAGYEFGGRARVAGTSAGAVVGSLVAAGATVTELTAIMQGLDYRRFRDASRFGALGDVLSLVTRLGMYRGDWLHGWIRDRLAGYGVHTFGDLRVVDPGSALPPERAYRLVVVVSDVTRGRLVRLPWDYHHYGLDPDTQPVADAVRASASIPFFFRPVELTGSCFVDGGMLSNFPIGLFDRIDDEAPRWPTFGVKLSARQPADGALSARPRSLLSLTKALVSTMVEAHDRLVLDDPSVLDRTVFVDTDGVSATDFELDANRRDLLYASGRAAGESFVAGWDFDRYLKKYR